MMAVTVYSHAHMFKTISINISGYDCHIMTVNLPPSFCGSQELVVLCHAFVSFHTVDHAAHMAVSGIWVFCSGRETVELSQCPSHRV